MSRKVLLLHGAKDHTTELGKTVKNVPKDVDLSGGKIELMGGKVSGERKKVKKKV